MWYVVPSIRLEVRQRYSAAHIHSCLWNTKQMRMDCSFNLLSNKRSLGSKFYSLIHDLAPVAWLLEVPIIGHRLNTIDRASWKYSGTINWVVKRSPPKRHDTMSKHDVHTVHITRFNTMHHGQRHTCQQNTGQGTLSTAGSNAALS